MKIDLEYKFEKIKQLSRLPTSRNCELTKAHQAHIGFVKTISLEFYKMDRD